MIIRENDEVNDQPEEVVLDHLHATAFQGHSLGYSILGPLENIKTITKKDLRDYIDKNYTAPRIVLAAAGGIEHEAVVDIAEKCVRLHVAHATCCLIPCFVHCLVASFLPATSSAIHFVHVHSSYSLFPENTQVLWQPVIRAQRAGHDPRWLCWL